MTMDTCIFYFIFSFAISNFVVLEAKKHKSHSKGNNDHRIVGGEEVTIQEYPYQVYVLVTRGIANYQCGGSMISDTYVLTAAHCLDGMQRADVRVGSTISNSGGTVYQSRQLIMHPLYNRLTFDYDIALIRMSTRMVLDGVNATTIRIPQQGITPAGGSKVKASGWGATSENGNTTTILRAVTLPVHTLAECKQMLGNTAITSRQFCAGPREGGKDTCQGDSGGPVVQNNTQVGIVSNGVGCARENSPGVYTNVGSFNRWIRLTTGGQVS